MPILSQFFRVVPPSSPFIKYVSVDGRDNGSGDWWDPMSMAYATGSTTPLTPGTKCYVFGGTYTPMFAGSIVGADGVNGTSVAGKGVYTLNTVGEFGNNIVFENYPGQKVRINGAVHLVSGKSRYTTFRGIEIAPTPTTRYFATKSLVDFPSLYITGPGCKFLNCYLHDFSGHHPFGTGDYEMHGNVIGWIGSYTDSGGWDNYNLYGHNHNGGLQLFRKNVWLYPFSNWNMAMWSATINGIKDYLVENNIFVNGQNIIGSAAGKMSNNIMRNNFGFSSRAEVGGLSAGSGPRVQAADNTDPDGEDVLYEYNYHYDRGGSGGASYFWTRYATVRYNTFLVHSNPGSCAVRRVPTGSIISVKVDDNVYGRWSDAGVYGASGFYDYGKPGGAGVSTLDEWRADTGWDMHSSYLTALPTDNVIGIIGNDYTPKRGFIYIYNYAEINTVDVDISSLGFSDGEVCRYRNCANMSEYLEFIYHAATPTLSISMQTSSWSRKLPTGWDLNTPPYPFHMSSFPNFGVFLIESASAA